MVNNSPILQWYEEEREKIEQARRYALNGLDQDLAKKQYSCGHIKETRYEALFYACGNTKPGMMCDYCGRKRDVDENLPKPKKKSLLSYLIKKEKP
jgi:predicted metal-binding transcription factor (methanogenesis marker protein 9)